MNIALIGMMGSGKTTVAKKLSDLLHNYSFIDTDTLIVDSQNMSINDIFQSKGESVFREIETETLKQVLKSDNQIISTGGGIIISDENIDLLKNNSIVFYLYADEKTLYKRIKDNKERPLLNNTDMSLKISTLLRQRAEKYEKAHFKIDTENKTPDQIAEEILRKSGLNDNR